MIKLVPDPPLVTGPDFDAGADYDGGILLGIDALDLRGPFMSHRGTSLHVEHPSIPGDRIHLKFRCLHL